MSETLRMSKAPKKVLVALAKGRNLINRERKAHADAHRILIYYLVLADGPPRRGQARRIWQAMNYALSESRIRKIISGSQFGALRSMAYPPTHHTGGSHNDV